jgi:regulator of replication initiation timing
MTGHGLFDDPMERRDDSVPAAGRRTRSPIDAHQFPDDAVQDTRMSDMAKVATRGIELEPIDRLEEKVKLLVAMVDRMKAEQARAAEENERLSRELEAMHARMSGSEATAAELATLRGERDAIRTRVTDMLEQLEALNL